MTYFTLLHWLVLGILSLILVLVVLLILRNESEKSPFQAILVSIFVFILIAGFSLYGLDSYTKVARLDNVTQKKILLNESLVVTGQIQNIGKFTIGKCRLEVKLSNNSFDKFGGTDSPLFVTKSILDGLFKKNQISNEIETSKTFVIAEMLHQGEMRNFSISMRYPPSFSKPSLRYELSCH